MVQKMELGELSSNPGCDCLYLFHTNTLGKA